MEEALGRLFSWLSVCQTVCVPSGLGQGGERLQEHCFGVLHGSGGIQPSPAPGSCCHHLMMTSMEEASLLAPQETDEEDLTPEERRKLERKLKKERKKEEKKLMREAGIPTKKEEPKKLSGSELALAYLTSWSKNPEEWKFQKTRQTWLLLHMYDKEKVPDEYFTILLDYLQGLQGKARDTTVQKAEALMKELDGSDAEDPSMVEKSERIRQVLQLLS
eukprot:XP_012955578.1 uncharacterized protein C7orf50 homolog isoform X1 [Anas platyrhynchos]